MVFATLDSVKSLDWILPGRFFKRLLLTGYAAAKAAKSRPKIKNYLFEKIKCYFLYGQLAYPIP